jgi:LuxR family transcriptional regulator, maltose regulon positive regulatory protein
VDVVGACPLAQLHARQATTNTRSLPTIPITTNSSRPSQELSDAERRILRLLATDLSLPEIGRELYLSANTVKTHTRSIYRKLGVSSRAEAVAAARTEALATRSTSPG